jgi:hypothetical protein
MCTFKTIAAAISYGSIFLRFFRSDHSFDHKSDHIQGPTGINRDPLSQKKTPFFELLALKNTE